MGYCKASNISYCTGENLLKGGKTALNNEDRGKTCFSCALLWKNITDKVPRIMHMTSKSKAMFVDGCQFCCRVWDLCSKFTLSTFLEFNKQTFASYKTTNMCNDSVSQMVYMLSLYSNSCTHNHS